MPKPQFGALTHFGIITYPYNALQICNRAFSLTIKLISTGTAKISVGVIGLEFNSLGVVCDCRVELPLLCVGKPTIVVSLS